jgi:heme-degrading monooxygenase HmoA
MTAMISTFPSNASVMSDEHDGQSVVERPVAVLSSYVVSSNSRAGWADLWLGISVQAWAWPGCRSFQVLSDRNDDMYCAVISQWDSLEAYNSFVRDSRLGWAMQTMRQLSIPGECRFLDIANGVSARDTGHSGS